MSKAHGGFVGIAGWGAYVPRRRLARSAIAEANVWFDGALRGLAVGDRSQQDESDCSEDTDVGGATADRDAEQRDGEKQP